MFPPNDVAALILFDWPLTSYLVQLAVVMAVLLGIGLLGFGVLRAFPILRLHRHPVLVGCESLVHGVIWFSLIATILAFLGISIIRTFLICSMGVALLQIFPNACRRNTRDRGVFASQIGNIEAIVAIALVAIGSLTWSIVNVRGLAAGSNGDYVLVPWVDILYHARMIGNFAGIDGDAGVINPYAYRATITPYHYGSYMVAALAVAVGKMPALIAATTIYPILGMLLTGASAFVFVAVLVRKYLLIPTAVILFWIPDPSFWYFHEIDRWFSYFFFQQVGVGGAYATAVIGLAISYIFRAKVDCRLSSLVLATAFGLIACLFKVTIVLAYGLPLAILGIAGTALIVRPWRFIAIGSVIILFILVTRTLPHIKGAPTVPLYLGGIVYNLNSLTGMNVEAGSSIPLLVIAPIAGVLVLLVRTYGVLLLASAVAMLRARRSEESSSAILVIAFALSAHVFARIVLASNDGAGDLYEVNGKTFVLPYFLVACGVAALIAGFFSTMDAKTFNGLRPAMIATIALLIVFTLHSARRVQDWPAIDLTYSRIDGNLLRMGARLRSIAATGEIVQYCRNDPRNLMATIAERPVYIARFSMYTRGALTDVERPRFELIQRIVQSSSYQEAVATARQARIGWLALDEHCDAPWEGQRDPVYRHGTARLYDLR